jgi:hypothetical protein
VSLAPTGGIEQLSLSWGQRLENIEVLASALVDRGVKLEVNLVDTRCEQDLQPRSIVAVLPTFEEALGQSEIKQRGGSWIKPVLGSLGGW